MTNKVVREKSRCDNCIADKLRFLKQKSNKKTGWININSKRFICQPLQSMLTNYLKYINDTESVDPRLLKKNVVEQFYHQNVQYVVVKNQDL